MGAETSKTRHAILDAVERLMVDRGYASVTYRALAAEAGVKTALVQYYFPTLDDVFLALIRRGIDGHVERLVAALDERKDEPLRVIWEFSKDEATSAFTIELMALGNHRKSIRAEIAQIADKVRHVQMEAMRSTTATLRYTGGELSPAALQFLLSGIPKLVTLEANVGMSTAHPEVMDAFERYLDAVEPRAPAPRQRGAKQSPKPIHTVES